jgi:hypothetical protein
VSNYSWHFFFNRLKILLVHDYVYMYIWTCGGRCKFLPFLIYNRQKHIDRFLSSCSQAKSSAHTMWIDRWKEDAEEEEEINRPNEKTEREKDRGLFVVTRYILITISPTSQWRPSTSSALLHARLAIYKKNANSEFDEERMKEEREMNRQIGRDNERTVVDFRSYNVFKW